MRPRIICKQFDTYVIRPFLGFNRAQFSVIEASVLVSRLGRISLEKILKVLLAVDKITKEIGQRLAYINVEKLDENRKAYRFTL